MNRTLANITFAAMSLALAGCQTPGTGSQSQPQPTTTLNYKLPVLVPVEPDKQTQEKDGIRISVAGYAYTPKQTVQREWRPLPAILVVNNAYPAEIRETPAVDVYPRDVRFKVKINNQLERVLRLAGTVVSFQVAGKAAAVPKAKYEDFLSGIILPRQETEYDLVGPALNEVPDNATIAFFLYDIVTATDAAGNPTKRSNFEFFYMLSRQAKTEDVPLTVKKVGLTQDLYELLSQRAGGPRGAWVSMPELDRIYDRK